MVNKQYRVTLNEKNVEEAQRKTLGSKLSPVLNDLLRIWLNFPKEVSELFSKLKSEEKEAIIKKK